MLILNIREICKIRRILEKDISLSTATSNWKFKDQQENCGVRVDFTDFA